MTARIQPTMTNANTPGPLGWLTTQTPRPIQTSRIAGPTKGFGLARGGAVSAGWTASVMPPRLSHWRLGAVLPYDPVAGDEASILALLHHHDDGDARLHLGMGPAGELHDRHLRRHGDVPRPVGVVHVQLAASGLAFADRS